MEAEAMKVVNFWKSGIEAGSSKRVPLPFPIWPFISNIKNVKYGEVFL